MKLGFALPGLCLTPDKLRFAKQAGATHIVAGLLNNSPRNSRPNTTVGASEPDESAWTYEGLRDLRTAVNNEGLDLEAIQGFEVAHWSDILLDGPRKSQQMEKLKTILRNLGRAGIPVMDYSFSIAGVWGRMPVRVARGGAKSPGFHDPPQPPIPSGMVQGRVYDAELYDPDNPKGVTGQITHEELWRRLKEFLDEILPVAEEARVKLALHPDDPPVPTLRGTPRLVYLPDHYQRVLDLNSSACNTMLFCVGTMAEMAEGDIYEMVDRYSRTGRITHVHMRNVRGRVPHYDEVFIDEGDVDMVRVLRILNRNGYTGLLAPDHGPYMSCDDPWHAGKAFIMGWLRAALACVER